MQIFYGKRTLIMRKERIIMKIFLWEMTLLEIKYSITHMQERHSGLNYMYSRKFSQRLEQSEPRGKL